MIATPDILGSEEVEEPANDSKTNVNFNQTNPSKATCYSPMSVPIVTPCFRKDSFQYLDPRFSPSKQSANPVHSVLRSQSISANSLSSFQPKFPIPTVLIPADTQIGPGLCELQSTSPNYNLVKNSSDRSSLVTTPAHPYPKLTSSSKTASNNYMHGNLSVYQSTNLNRINSNPTERSTISPIYPTHMSR